MDRIAEFGERVLFFVPAKTRKSLEPKWRNGIFIGRAWGSDQNFIALLDGTVTRARAMVRTVPSIRWDTQRCKNVAGTPHRMNDAAQDLIEESAQPHSGPDGQREDDPDTDDAPEHAHKRMPILIRDLHEHGYTEGCNQMQVLS